MAKRQASDERTRLLRALRRRRFDCFWFAGSDAQVALVPDGGALPPAVQAKLAERVPSRWYPVEGGHLVKWPWQGGPVPGAGFGVEVGRWNHEHCDACDRTIAVGGTVGLTVRGSFYKLCPYCYRRLTNLGSALAAGPHAGRFLLAQFQASVMVEYWTR